MAQTDNRSWNLERFVDSFILELDRAQDTLAVKGVNRKLTYTVRDVNLDLHVFPKYDGRRVDFTTARPGEEGASRLSIQLGSITDRQIVDHAAAPPDVDDVKIEEIEDLDDEVKETLQSVGIRSEKDLERVAEERVDVGNLVERRTGKRTDYGKLAGLIRRSKRRRAAPRVLSVDIALGDAGPELRLEGENLVLHPEAGGDFPSAFLNQRHLRVVHASPTKVHLALSSSLLDSGENRLSVALDEGAVVNLNIET